MLLAVTAWAVWVVVVVYVGGRIVGDWRHARLSVERRAVAQSGVLFAGVMLTAGVILGVVA